MAEEINSYLQYNDGFVLHNGLPVKWSVDGSVFKKFDLILEMNNFNSTYNGVSFPLRCLLGKPGTASTAWDSQTPENILQGASAYWGTEIKEADGDVKLKTNANQRCEIVHKTGSSATIHNTYPRLPSEGYSANIYGVVFPSAQNHYYVGVKFPNNYGCPDKMDLTNHGSSANGGYSTIQKLYGPNVDSCYGMMNASNYSAMKNVYLPKARDNNLSVPRWAVKQFGVNSTATDGNSEVKCRLFQNCNFGSSSLFFSGNATAEWSANRPVSNMSAIGVTARYLNSSAIGGGNFDLFSGCSGLSGTFAGGTTIKDMYVPNITATDCRFENASANVLTALHCTANNCYFTSGHLHSTNASAYNISGEWLTVQNSAYGENLSAERIGISESTAKNITADRTMTVSYSNLQNARAGISGRFTYSTISNLFVPTGRFERCNLNGVSAHSAYTYLCTGSVIIV